MKEWCIDIGGIGLDNIRKVYDILNEWCEFKNLWDTFDNFIKTDDYIRYRYLYNREDVYYLSRYSDGYIIEFKDLINYGIDVVLNVKDLGLL